MSGALPRPSAAPAPSYIRDGVEFFDVPGHGQDAQCARCGSSISSEFEDSIDLGPIVYHGCLSSAEWCNAHPMPGRESQKGAGR